MLNQVVLVGSLLEDPKFCRINRKKRSVIMLAVQSPDQDSDGDLLTHVFPITLGLQFAKAVVSYCKAGSTLGIKARLIPTPDGNVTIYPEKITFINVKGSL
jgi:single-stranded DNA-binding protein